MFYDFFFATFAYRNRLIYFQCMEIFFRLVDAKVWCMAEKLKKKKNERAGNKHRLTNT